MVQAEQGDFSGMRDLLGVAQANNDRAAENPAYRRDKEFLAREDGESVLDKFKESVLYPSRYSGDYWAAKNRLKTETPNRPGQDPTTGDNALWQQGVDAYKIALAPRPVWRAPRPTSARA